MLFGGFKKDNLIFQIVRKFQIGWNGGELDTRSLLINKPDGPIKLTFFKRDN